MSGVCGLLKLDGAPVEPAELSDMTSLLARRGPDGSGVWHAGEVGLGHTLLETTPEAGLEALPLEHGESGCVITGDVRLDNRGELLAGLNVTGRASVISDVELMLLAYLAWGEGSVERFLGDFAFAVWDPRTRTLFCARDQIGMRPFYYHCAPGRLFAFASDPRAILVLQQIPYRFDEGRIADYLLELEAFDATSTFFADVLRLPPGHKMTVSAAGVRQRRYWHLEPEPELRLGSNDEYAEVFLDVFAQAVRCRLRTTRQPGSMLSGGIDSGAVVAVASQQLAADGHGPLATLSAVSPEGEVDPETRAIKGSLTMPGIEPHIVGYDELDDLLPDLLDLTFEMDEPFDGHMTLIRAVYLLAHRHGINVVLDGAGGDVVLDDGRRLARLLRAGHWRTAYREATGLERFYKGLYRPRRELLRAGRVAFVPDVILRQVRPLRRRLLAGRMIREALLDEGFARRVNLAERLRALERRDAARPLSSGGTERARALQHRQLTAGRERYERAAAATSIEPRDPFLDLRLLRLCTRLPDSQVLDHGWPKAILRRATAGQLPDATRWRAGKEHLGWPFTNALMTSCAEALWARAEPSLNTLAAYIRLDASTVHAALSGRGGAIRRENAYNALCLAMWFEAHEDRPQGRESKGGQRT